MIGAHQVALIETGSSVILERHVPQASHLSWAGIAGLSCRASHAESSSMESPEKGRYCTGEVVGERRYVASRLRGVGARQRDRGVGARAPADSGRNLRHDRTGIHRGGGERGGSWERARGWGGSRTPHLPRRLELPGTRGDRVRVLPGSSGGPPSVGVSE